MSDYQERERERRSRLSERNSKRAQRLYEAAMAEGAGAEDKFYDLLFSDRTTKDVLQITVGYMRAAAKSRV